MTAHRFEAVGPSRTSWDRLALIIEIPSIEPADLRSAAYHLLSLLDALAEEIRTDPNRMFPVLFDVNGRARFSERSFWRILLENSASETALVVDYIEALAARSLEFNHAEEYAAGANAVFSALDLLLESNESAAPASLPLYDAFYLYLSRLCDLDHEVYEDDYIYRVMPKLQQLDRSRYLELLHLRMFNGVYSADATPFHKLHGIFGPKRKPDPARQQRTRS